MRMIMHVKILHEAFNAESTQRKRPYSGAVMSMTPVAIPTTRSPKAKATEDRQIARLLGMVLK